MLLNYFHSVESIEVGCDEAGRGCLAGPVCAAAVILHPHFYHPLLNDSKKTKEKDRLILRDYIQQNALAYAVAFVDHIEIDKINILKASIKAMHIALDSLKKKFDVILVDGNRFYKYKNITHHCIIKGDGKYASIAAASILAKTARDEYMQNLHLQCPQYYWDKNMGYPTKAHRQAIDKIGHSPYHRKTFTYKVIDEPTLPF